MASDATIRRYTLDEAIRTASHCALDATAYDPDHDAWAGGSIESALRWAREGRPDYVQDLRLDVGTTARIRSGTRPAPVYDAVGSDIDISRWISGHPEACIEMRRTVRPAPVLRIAVEIVVPGYTKQEEIRDQGRSVFIAIESLRTLGISSEIWVTASLKTQYSHHDTNAPTWLSYQILVQEAGRPINVAVLAYWIIDPTALRRIVFSLMEHEDSATRRAYAIHKGGGYGLCQSQSSLISARLYDDFDEIAPRSPAFEPDQLRHWLRDLLMRRGGVEIAPGDK